MSPEDTPKEERTALEPSEAQPEQRLVAPAVDIYEDDAGLVIVADMPGVKKDDVSATVDAGVLTIEGRRSTAEEQGMALYTEYEPADFHRCFSLGESIDPEGISAELKAGVLTVHLPKAESAKTKKIQITGG